MAIRRARFVSFTVGTRSGWGRIDGDRIIDLSMHAPSLRTAIAGVGLDLMSDAEGSLLALADVTLTIPVPDAEKIICVGVNYPDRNAEYKDGQEAPPNPSLFIRFARSFAGHGEPLLRPPESAQFDYEGEVVIVIGKGGRRITEDRAWDHIAGITIANEGTLRDWVRHAKFNVTQGKNFDHSGAIGPWLVPFTDRAQLADIALETRINGEVRQQDRTGRMIFPIPRLIAYISTFTTLHPGDTILTGTPTGAGARHDPPLWLVPGDRVEVEVQGIGILANAVADEGGA